MTLSTFEAVGTHRRLVELPIEVLGFGGTASFTLGNINLNLTIRLMGAATQFHNIDSRMSYHFWDLRSISINLSVPHITNALKPSENIRKSIPTPLNDCSSDMKLIS